MTEKTPEKKPRRKRRTKAEIEAEKAAEVAANIPDIPYEPVVRDREAERARLEARQEAAVVKEEKPTAVTSKEAVKEEPAVSAKPADTKKAEEPYVELTGLAKIRARVATRRLRDIR